MSVCQNRELGAGDCLQYSFIRTPAKTVRILHVMLAERYKVEQGTYRKWTFVNYFTTFD